MHLAAHIQTRSPRYEQLREYDGLEPSMHHHHERWDAAAGLRRSRGGIRRGTEALALAAQIANAFAIILGKQSTHDGVNWRWALTHLSALLALPDARATAS